LPIDHLYPPKNDAELLELIAKDKGVDVDTLLELATLDSSRAGICTTCHTIHDDCEPDAEENACSECEENTVKSALVLGGLI
jgi:hypothetical protein